MTGNIMYISTYPNTDRKLRLKAPKLGKFSQQPVVWKVQRAVTAVQLPQHLHHHPDETPCTVFSAAARKKSPWQVRPGVRAETQHCNWQRGLTAAMWAGMLTSWFSNGDIKFYSRAGALSLPSMFGRLWQQVCFSHGRTVGGAKEQPTREDVKTVPRP